MYPVTFVLSGAVEPDRVVNDVTDKRAKATAFAFVERVNVAAVEVTVNAEPNVNHVVPVDNFPCKATVAFVEPRVAPVVILSSWTVNSLNTCGKAIAVPPPVVT